MNRHFTTTILEWFEENRRDLPWRETSDPYAIWLSEIILQQTRIQQGMAYWQRFMERWPTVEQLAAATEDEVLRLWQGLGYYSRARNLHAAAQQIVAMGGFPTTFEGIRSLKGVGDYTAAAIASIAFGQEAFCRLGTGDAATRPPIRLQSGHDGLRGHPVYAHIAPLSALSAHGEL